MRTQTKKAGRRHLLTLGTVLLGLALIVGGLIIHLYIENKNFEADIMRARENFPAIQAELEDGIERLIPLLEGVEEVTFTDPDKADEYKEYYERKLGKDMDTALSIGKELIRLDKFVDIYFFDTPHCFKFRFVSNGSGYVEYIYQEEENNEHQEKLAENWYLFYGRFN